jgi:hypothetical protein
MSPSNYADRYVKPIYKSHFRALEEWGVLAQVGMVAAVLVAICVSYFAIDKAGQSPVARAIFSGRQFSKLFAIPHPINLPELPLVFLVWQQSGTIPLRSTSATLSSFSKQLCKIRGQLMRGQRKPILTCLSL